MKSYPHKNILQVASKDIFPLGTPKARPYSVAPKGKAKNPERALAESKRRAAAKVYDIALLNDFQYMFTLTLDPARIDRYDIAIIGNKLKTFLSNMGRRHGFSYIVIPEYHNTVDEEGRRAVHFHGLCSLGNMPIERALSSKGRPLTDQAGRPIYNMPTWIWGFSTCVPIDIHYERTIAYIAKYITKGEEKILGKWYLCSRNLKKKPDIIPLSPIPYNDYRDEVKLKVHLQTETEIYPTLRLITEELPQKEDITENE